MIEHSLGPARRPQMVITPSRGWRLPDPKELWRYRDLLITLAGRDLKLRYRQTALGIAWIVLGPLLAAGLFSFVFGQVAKLPSEGVPYFLFVFAGQLGWNVFSSVVTRTGGSLIGNQALVSKIYFPRMLLPLSAVFGVLIDFGVALAALALLMIINGVTPHAGLLFFPVFLLLLLLGAVGLGLIVSALTVTYRDTANVLGVLLPFLMYSCPVLYSVQAVPARLLPFYYLNPLAALMQGFRWSLLPTQAPPWGYVAYAAVWVAVVFLIGTLVFHRMERRFADII